MLSDISSKLVYCIFCRFQPFELEEKAYLGLIVNFYCFYRHRGKDSQGEEVIKPYTPTTLDSDVGYFELVIKVHFSYICQLDYCWLDGIQIQYHTLAFLGSHLVCFMTFFTDVSTRENVSSF